MTSTVFVNGVTLSDSGWFNDLNALGYTHIINVKNSAYGATGDGVTDDTTAITAADAAAFAAGGGVVLFPVGTYVHTGLTPSSNVLWLGVNRVGVTLINTNNAAGLTISNLTGFSIDRITVSQSGNANSVDAISVTGSSNMEWGDIAVVAPGRYGISFNGGASAGCHNNTIRRLDITNLSGTKRGVYFQKATNRNNGNKILGGRCNNGAYAVYIDTDSAFDNEFYWTTQEQTSACYYVDSGNNMFCGYVENSGTAGNGFTLTANASGSYIAPRVLTISGGGVTISAPAGSPVSAAPRYIYLPPTGATDPARLENLDVNILRSDIGSGSGQGYVPITANHQYLNYAVSTATTEIASSYTLPSNSVTGSSYVLELYSFGTTDASAASKKVEMFVGAGGTRLVCSMSTATAAVVPWSVKVSVMRTGASSQIAHTLGFMGSGPTTFAAIDQRTTALDQDMTSTIPITVELTGANGSGSMTAYAFWARVSQ